MSKKSSKPFVLIAVELIMDSIASTLHRKLTKGALKLSTDEEHKRSIHLLP